MLAQVGNEALGELEQLVAVRLPVLVPRSADVVGGDRGDPDRVLARRRERRVDEARSTDHRQDREYNCRGALPTVVR